MNSRQIVQLLRVAGNRDLLLMHGYLSCLINSTASRTQRSCHNQQSQENKNKAQENLLKNNPKDDLLPNFINRNPRNLEMLRIARKPQGYDLDARPPSTYYSLEYKQEGRHTEGMVRHKDGEVVLRASTQEWPLQSRLPSTADKTAAVTVAKVLARRCLEAGITEMGTDLFAAARSSAKVSAFLSAVSGNGVRLEEDFQLHEVDMYPWSRERPTLPWDVREEIELPKYDQYNKKK